MQPKVLITTGLGINSHEELGKAYEMVGAKVDFVLTNDLIANPDMLDDYQGMGLAGGFSMGDQLGAGQSLANRIRMSDLRDKLAEKLEDSNFPTYIVCNHLQVLAKLDLFPVPVGTVANDSGKHETLSWDVDVNPYCNVVWLDHLKDYEGPIFAPISHGEGRIVVLSEHLAEVEASGLVALTYQRGHMCDFFKSSRGDRYNPNGSVEDIAGFGWANNLVLFPHFERLLHNLQRDDKDAIKSGDVRPKFIESTPDGVFEPTYLMFKGAVDFMYKLMDKQA